MSKDKGSFIKGNYSDYSVGIVRAKYNEALGDELYKNTLSALLKQKVKEASVTTIEVPGALEIAYGIRKLIEKVENLDVVIALGIVIRGDTYHFEMVCDNTYSDISRLQDNVRMPIIKGILTVDNIEAAALRVLAGKKKFDGINYEGLNKGKEFAEAALTMAKLGRG